MKIYKTSDYKIDIVEVEASRKTDKSVWIKLLNYKGVEVEERIVRHTGEHDYWDTFEEAKSYSIKRLADKIKQLESQLKIAKDNILKVEGYVL